MTRHKFAIGQIVDFDTRITPMPRPGGPYQVVRILPAEDVRSQTYRIKSKAEPFERSAKEYEILAVGLPPTEGAATVAERPGADPMRRQRVSRPFLSR